MNNRWAYFGLALLLTGGACGGDPPPPPPKAPEPPTPAESIPEESAMEPDAAEVAYAYSPIGKRDPFRSIFEEMRIQGPEGGTPLQQFEVDQLRLTAIITGRATPYAMVEDPNGKGHTVTRGTLVGKNWGRVTAITPDCMVIKEEYRDYTGRKVENKIDVCIPADDKLKLD